MKNNDIKNVAIMHLCFESVIVILLEDRISRYLQMYRAATVIYD